MKTYCVHIKGKWAPPYLLVDAENEVAAAARAMLDLEKMRGMASTTHNIVRAEIVN